MHSKNNVNTNSPFIVIMLTGFAFLICFAFIYIADNTTGMHKLITTVFKLFPMWLVVIFTFVRYLPNKISILLGLSSVILLWCGTLIADLYLYLNQKIMLTNTHKILINGTSMCAVSLGIMLFLYLAIKYNSILSTKNRAKKPRHTETDTES